MDPKRKFFLFKQSENFCSVPWNYFKVDMKGDVTTCVNGKKLLGNLANNNIEEILLNPTLLNIRQNLSQDLIDSNCQSCRSYENVEGDQNYKFLRDLYNPMFKSADINYDDSSEFKLHSVDLHWSSICDLKCITCWHKQSSSIAKEEGKEILHTPSEQADRLINYIVDNQESLKEIYLSGGEPTLIKHNLKLLKRLRRDLPFQIRINTNMMFEQNNQIINELKEFPNVLFTISSDAMDKKFNYIRRGADWDKFLTNLDALLQTHFTWRLNSVFFVGSALHLTETQNFFFNRYGINDFTINQCQMGHTELECRNLPESIKQIVKAKLVEHQEMHKNNLNLFGQLKNCIDELDKSGVPNYQNYFQQVGSKAGTNWTTVFPELLYAN